MITENNNVNIIQKFKNCVFSLDNYNSNNISIKKTKNDKKSFKTKSQTIIRIIHCKTKDNINQIDNIELYKTKILEILITFFYYEKYFIENKNQIFNENNNNYYLINQEWFNNYYEQYEYINLHKSLLNISKNNTKINYNNLNNYISEYIKINLKKNIINAKKETIKHSADIESIFEKTNKINNHFIFNNCYIIHSKIIDLINKYHFQNKNISNNLKKIYIKNDFIYFIDVNNLIIGNLVDQLLFIPKYIINYCSKQILETEKNIMPNKYKY